MHEYHPELWRALKEDCKPLLDEHKRKLIHIYQTASFTSTAAWTVELKDTP